MTTDLEELERALLARLAAANDETSLEALRVEALGKQGSISALMKNLGSMSPDERKTFGGALNVLKDKLTEQIVTKKAAMAEAALDRQLQSEAVDVTLPPVRPRLGTIHPVSQVMEELAQIFGEMGFSVEEGPDIETDFNNFTALNFPPNHPARETHDTFFLDAKGEDGARKVLRTHTSPVQVRTMLKQKPPIRMICMGRTFRKDSDATHTPMFHQIEGLVIDETSTMADLKSVLIAAIKAYFEVDDVQACVFARTISRSPNRAPKSMSAAIAPVVTIRDRHRRGLARNPRLRHGASERAPKQCGLDPEKYQGYAFGMGIDRLAMLKYGMPDLRDFFAADNALAKALRLQPVSAARLWRRAWGDGRAAHRDRRRFDFRHLAAHRQSRDGIDCDCEVRSWVAV